MSLVLNYLDIDAQKEPDFVAALRYLETLSDEKCLAAFRRVYGYDPEQLEVPRLRLKHALKTINGAWQGRDRRFVQFIVRGIRLLIGGGEYWGDSQRACDEIMLFEASGMARVAGFGEIEENRV